MTRRIGNTLIIEKENNQQCDYCGKIAELRPYGKNNAVICFDCAMKDVDTVQEVYKRRLGINA